ncbi:MAG: hypothetical protein K2H11_01345, partial [Malacoplasma sp.]|nr:hypothetical protein [Malacoplasma sp.]
SIVSCSSSQSFYLANYESYISDNLLSELENEFSSSNFNYRTYSTNEDLERNFLTNYDVAIPSLYLAAKYANEGKLLPIDWESFELHQLDENGIQKPEMIKNAKDALTLFTPQTRNQLTAYWLEDAYKIDNIDEINQEAGLLNYCVPYFLQDVSFGYNLSIEDKKIKELKWNDYINHISNLNNSLQSSWNEIIKYLYEKINDGSLKERTAIVDDYSTLYSIARIMQTENDETTVNPDYTKSGKLKSYEGNLSIEESFDTLKYLFNFNQIKRKNSILLNSDSNTILNDFAKNFSQAIISYNGDLLYAMQGGDDFSYTTNEKDFQEWMTKNLITIKENETSKKRDFKLKLVKPDQTLSVMDCMVINKELTTKKGTVETAHEVIKKIGLEGSDFSLYESSENKIYPEERELIFDTNEDDEYIYGPMLNFDYVNYTSPLLTINAYVMNSSSDLSKYELEDSYSSFSIEEQSNGYFTESFSWINQTESKNGFLSEEEYNNYIETLINTYYISEEKDYTKYINLLNKNLPDLVKNNISWAWSSIKSNL